MTLLTTEILEGQPFSEPFIVFAADRRISVNGRPNAARKKVFRVPGYDAGIGYFGLAEVPCGQDRQPMDEWLREFLTERPAVGGLKSLATDLASALNSVVPSAWRRRHVSGMHLAGFDDGGSASFWFVRNVNDDCMTLLGAYQAREDYRRRDARGLGPSEHVIYRNGDIRAHVAAWEAIDRSFGGLLGLSDFRSPANPDDYVRWVRFKMNTIARFYKEFCATSIIGEPIDAFAVRVGDGTRSLSAVKGKRVHSK